VNRARLKQAIDQVQFEQKQSASPPVSPVLRPPPRVDAAADMQDLHVVDEHSHSAIADTNSADNSHAARLLLQLEAEARRAATGAELDFIIANETRKLTRSRQIFVFRAASKMRLSNISGLPNMQRAAPLVDDFERLIHELGREIGFEARQQFSLRPENEIQNGEIQNGEIQSNETQNGTARFSPRTTLGGTLAQYPFHFLLWSPFKDRADKVTGGMLLAREQPWQAADIAVIDRLSDTFQHASASLASELQKVPKIRTSSLVQRKYVLAAIIAIIGVMVVPVSLSTLAPFEITAANPFVVSAPFDGVIEEVMVKPGEKVKKDQPLIRFSDTVLKNRFEVAKRKVFVAEARLKKSSQLAFNDKNGRQGLRLGMAEVALKKSEFNFASQMYERATVKAQRDGVAVFSDRQELIGKPVAPGELILQIADPTLIEISIDVAVNDAILLKPGARAKIYLDSDPVHAREAKILFSDYQARTVSGDNLAFRTVARFAGNESDIPRIGVRGTAQLYGDKAPLAFYLFRRPLSAVRQWLGI
jgi:multidrug resistance efflux pump